MDVKACDNCKKMNLDTELFYFWENRMRDPENPGRVPTKDSVITGFTLAKASPEMWCDITGTGRHLETLCKPCARTRIMVDLKSL
jgi:hypothetical protein